MCIVKLKDEDDYVIAARPRRSSRVSYYAEYPNKLVNSIPAPAVVPLPAPIPRPQFVQPRPTPIFVQPPTPPPAAFAAVPSPARHEAGPQFVEMHHSRSPSVSSRPTSEHYRREVLREMLRENERDRSPARSIRHSVHEPVFETVRVIEAPGEERETFERARYVRRSTSRSRSRSTRRDSYGPDSPRAGAAPYGERVRVVVTDEGGRRRSYRY